MLEKELQLQFALHTRQRECFGTKFSTQNYPSNFLDAHDSLDALDSLDARDSLDAIDARDLLDTINARDALDAHDAHDALTTVGGNLTKWGRRRRLIVVRGKEENPWAIQRMVCQKGHYKIGLHSCHPATSKLSFRDPG